MDQPTLTNNHARNRAFLILGVVAVIGGLVWLTHMLLVGRYHQTTDDAYISSDLVQITSEVPGTVIAVNVDDTQSVERGQVLAELDPADAQVAINGAEAQLARAVRNVRGLFAQRDQLQAQIAQRVADLKRVQDDLRSSPGPAVRRRRLGRGAVAFA